MFDMLIAHQKRYGFSVGSAFLKETGEFIGRAGIVHLDFQETPDVELACFLMPAYWKNGYAIELVTALIDYAFTILKVPRVFATVDVDNVAARRIPEKLGMTLEKVDTYKTLDKLTVFYVKYAKDM